MRTLAKLGGFEWAVQCDERPFAAFDINFKVTRASLKHSIILTQNISTQLVTAEASDTIMDFILIIFNCFKLSALSLFLPLDGDMEVDLKKSGQIDRLDIETKCSWTPWWN